MSLGKPTEFYNSVIGMIVHCSWRVLDKCPGSAVFDTASCSSEIFAFFYTTTVEPPNNGHVGIRGCPLFGG